MPRRPPDPMFRLTMSLTDPGMTPVLRTAMLGLYMTLERVQIVGLDVTLTSETITLAWERAHAHRVLEVLYARGLALDRQGIMDFEGWRNARGEAPPRLARVHAQEALTLTLLQHGSRRTFLQNPVPLTVQTPDGDAAESSTQGLDSFAHQTAFVELAKRSLKRHGDTKTIRIVSWLYPGAKETHPARTWSRMEVTPAQYLALCFLPVSAIAHVCHSSSRGRPQAKRSMAGHTLRPREHERAALCTWPVTDLEQEAAWRRQWAQRTPQDATISGAEDLLLRLYDARQACSNKEILQVIAYGHQDWNTNQKTITWRAGDRPHQASLDMATQLLSLRELAPMWARGAWRPNPVWECMSQALVANTSPLRALTRACAIDPSQYTYPHTREALRAVLNELSPLMSYAHTTAARDDGARQIQPERPSGSRDTAPRQRSSSSPPRSTTPRHSPAQNIRGARALSVVLSTTPPDYLCELLGLPGDVISRWAAKGVDASSLVEVRGMARAIAQDDPLGTLRTLGWTFGQVARAIDTDRSQLWNWYHGVTTLGDKRFEALVALALTLPEKPAPLPTHVHGPVTPSERATLERVALYAERHGKRKAAQLLGCHPSTVHRWLSGARRPRPHMQDKLLESPVMTPFRMIQALLGVMDESELRLSLGLVEHDHLEGDDTDTLAPSVSLSNVRCLYRKIMTPALLLAFEQEELL